MVLETVIKHYADTVECYSA